MSPNPPPLPPSAARHSTPRWPLLFLLIPAFIVAALVYVRFNLRNQVQQKAAAIKKAKLPTSGAELNHWLPTVPSAENGALILTQAFARLQLLPDHRSNLVNDIDLLKTNLWSPEVRTIVRDHLSSNAPALQLIEQALEHERFRFPIDFTPGFATLLPHLARAKSTSTLLSLRTAAAAQDGRTNEFPRYFQQQIKFAETLNSENYLIAFLVRVACLRMAVNTLEHTLNQPTQPTPPPLPRELQQALLRAAETNLLHPALIAERAITIPLFSMDINDVLNLADSVESTKAEPSSAALSFFLRVTGAYDRDQKFYLDTMQTVIDIARSDAPENLILSDEIKSAAVTAKSRVYIISSMLLPALAKTPDRQATCQAYLRAAATALAIENFRRTHGKLPENLEELVPEFLAAVPADPFDDEPLRYQQLDPGYRVYSIGPDLSDDDGLPEPKKRLPTQSPHDLTFTLER